MSGEVFCICLNNGDKGIKSSGRLEAVLELQAEGRALCRSNHSQHRWGEGKRQIAAHNGTAFFFFFSGILVKGAREMDPSVQWDPGRPPAKKRQMLLWAAVLYLEMVIWVPASHQSLTLSTGSWATRQVWENASLQPHTGPPSLR